MQNRVNRSFLFYPRSNIAANWLRMELPDRFRSRAGIRDFTQQAAGQALMTRLRPASFER
jgi:hypothetical protein